MQLDQPPPDAIQVQPSIFSHLRPQLWKDSKGAHITLVVLGTLMLLPAGLALFALIQLFLVWGGFGSSMLGSEDIVLPALSAGLSSCLGVLAWSALCMLFFKRTDARWQRICWAFAAVFGLVSAPSILGWMIWMGSEGMDEAWVFLIFMIMLGASAACLGLGLRYSLAAHRELRRPPAPDDPAYYA